MTTSRPRIQAAALLVLALTIISVFVSLRPPPRAAPSAPDERPRDDQPRAAALLWGEPLDLNLATEDDLAALPGIGPDRARRIARWRARHGRFAAVDDLADVPGIGPKTLERLRPSLTVEAAR